MLDAGMRVRAGGHAIALDHCDGDVCFVSHAHSDHTTALKTSKPILASDETLALAGANGGTKRHSHASVSLLNSGHILGSSQLFAERDGSSLVYTGDFKLEDGLTTKGAEVRQCDTLILEATFGSPEFIFPSRHEVFDALSFWIKQKLERGSILLGAYSTGKSQEVIKFLNEYLGISPLVHERVEKACAVYEKFGVRLSRIPFDSPEAEELKKKNFIAVFPPRLASQEHARDFQVKFNRRFFSAVATGWALNTRLPVDTAFPLTDHAGFNDLLAYCERASPKKIYTTHGFEEELAAALRKKGFSAQPASSKQTHL